MGSKKPIPQTSLELCFDTGSVTTITNLFNAMYYFLEYVFIIIADGDYRLLVILHNQVLWDKKYKTIKGAKIAFKRRFAHMAYKPSIEQHWSPMYPPDNDWLMPKLNLANSTN